MRKEIEQILKRQLPAWAVKPHPTMQNMSAIHPMAIIDVLNEAFGIGGWKFHAREIEVSKEIQKTQKGDRQVWVSAVHGTLIVPAHDIHVEQFGGNQSADKGDSLKGGATDALTKCASYLGVGATIYKGQGNVDGFTMSTEDAWTKLMEATTLDELTAIFKSLPEVLRKDAEVIAKATEIKNKLNENV